LRPPVECPVCHDTSVRPVKHQKGLAARLPTGYRCSSGHVFQVLPSQESRRSKQLREQVRETRAATQKQVERARKLVARRRP